MVREFVDNKVRKPVSFNRTKKNDIEMLKFLGRRNFSGYVKKLIQADMQEREIQKGKMVYVEKVEPLHRELEAVPIKPQVSEEGKSETTSERLQRLKSELSQGKDKNPRVFISPHLKK